MLTTALGLTIAVIVPLADTDVDSDALLLAEGIVLTLTLADEELVRAELIDTVELAVAV